MIKTFATCAVMAAASLSLVAGAQAAGAAGSGADGQGQFYATPIQKGAPTDLPGERMIPGASETAGMMDRMMGPMMQPMMGMMGGEKTAAATPAAAPAKHRHMMMRKHDAPMQKKMMAQ